MSVWVLWPHCGALAPSGEQGSPDSAAIAEALDAVGLGSCSIAGGIVHKKRASTCFDFFRGQRLRSEDDCRHARPQRMHRFHGGSRR